MLLRIVLDTNCLVSAFFTGNYSNQIVDLARKKKLAIITSRTLNSELSEVFRRRVVANQLKKNHFLNKILALSLIVSPAKTIVEIDRDPDDNRVLEAAVEGKCDFIVTGDKDLLELKKYKNIRILAPKDFLEENSLL